MVNSSLLDFGGIIVGTSATLNLLMDGSLLQAALIPALGCGIKQIGDYYRNNQISSLGISIIAGSLFSLPVTPMCHVILAQTENPIIARLFSSICGTALLYKTVDFFTKDNRIAI